MDHNKLWKIFEVIGMPDHLTNLLRNLYAVQETAVTTGHETTDWFKRSGKEDIKAVYFHSTYLTYMQSASCKIPGWKNNKMESRFTGEISITSDMQMIPPQWQKAVQFSSVAQSCPTLCDPLDWSMPGLPVHYQLPEFTQTHVQWVSDAIQPSHHLSFPSPTFSLSQNQGLFKWISSSHQVAKVLEFWLQHQSLQWIFRTDFL